MAPLNRAKATHTESRCKCEAPSAQSKGLTSWIDSNGVAGPLSVCFWRGLFVKAAEDWIGPLRQIGTILERTRWAVTEIFGPVLPAAVQSEVPRAIFEGASATSALLLKPEALGLTALVAVGAAVSNLVWRNWDAHMRGVRRVGSIALQETIALAQKPSTAGSGIIGSGFRPPRAGDREFPPSIRGDSSRLHIPRESGATQPISPTPTWAVRLRPISHSSLDNTLLRASAVAMIAAPLLVTPAGAELTSIRAEHHLNRAGSVTINSSPTIHINVSKCEDIEQLVLEALRHHRETIYMQWCCELQRRQRTEF